MQMCKWFKKNAARIQNRPKGPLHIFCRRENLVTKYSNVTHSQQYGDVQVWFFQDLQKFEMTATDWLNKFFLRKTSSQKLVKFFNQILKWQQHKRYARDF